MQNPLLRPQKKLWQFLQKRKQRLKQQSHRLLQQYIKDRSLRWVERFVFGWLVLFGLIIGLSFVYANRLDDHYLTHVPDDGGRFSEGMVGELEMINPLFAGNRISRSVEALVFNGLFRRDGQGEIVPDLAREYDINEDGTTYTVQLRDDASWHDGVEVTAEDVEYTFQTIQKPETGSSMRQRWEDIEIQAVDESTVEFQLPNPYAPFLEQLTTGIVPKHKLSDIEPQRLRGAGFSTDPIGTGPFRFDRVNSTDTVDEIRLRANPDFYGGAPRLDEFVIVAYPDMLSVTRAYNRDELSSMVLGSEFDPSLIDEPHHTQRTEIASMSQVLAFFNTERLENAKLRRSLGRSIDTVELTSQLGPGYARTSSPLLPEHMGYERVQPEFDAEAAESLLQESDWSRGDDSSWQREGETLELEIVTLDRDHYQTAARHLQEQWQQLGIDVSIALLEGEELQTSHIQPRDFDVLLFGIEHTSDPDVYAYWHSSQTGEDGRNVSQYDSETADINLEDGRTRSDPEIRAAKYRAFQATWAEDVPAVALYRPRQYHIWRQEAGAISVEGIVQTVDRYHNVIDWTIRTRSVPRRLQE